MKKLLLLTKTLLAVALLCVGQNAWGEETPVWSVNFADISTSTTSAISNFTWSADYVVVGQAGWSYKSSYATETGTHFAWARQRSNDKQYGFCFRNSAVFCQSSPYAMTIIDLKENYKVTVVTSVNAIASSFQGNNGGTWTESVNGTNTEYTYTMSSDGDLNLMVAAGAYVYSVSVVEVSGLEATKYTVKYQNASGDDLKDAVEYDTYVGETFTASASDMATFYSADTNKKYIYKSGNTSTAAVADAASNVITLVFDEYAKFVYTVTAKNGEEILGTLASGDAYADGSTSVTWNKFKQYESKWYETTGSYGKTITEAGNTDVAYTASDIDYFFEAENLTTSRSGFPTASGFGYSGGSSRRNYASGQMWTGAITEGGVYTLTFPYSMANASESTIVIKTRDEGGNYTTTGLSLTTSSAGTFSNAITIPAGSSVAICNDNGWNSNILIDYLTLTKISSVSVTVTDAGYATYVPSYDLDFSATDIEAYKVKVSSKGVATMTQVDNVPAGTPVLLYKDGGAEEDIPVMTGAAAVTENDLVAGTGAAVATTDGEYTNMILNNIDSKIGFYFANGQTVAANRAYLHIATSLAPDAVGGSARMAMFFTGSVTGVENVEAASEATVKEGKFIENGKLIIVKNGQKYNAAGAKLY